MNPFFIAESFSTLKMWMFGFKFKIQKTKNTVNQRIFNYFFGILFSDCKSKGKEEKKEMT